jgi:hypothetical protein
VPVHDVGLILSEGAQDNRSVTELSPKKQGKNYAEADSAINFPYAAATGYGLPGKP